MSYKGSNCRNLLHLCRTLQVSLASLIKGLKKLKKTPLFSVRVRERWCVHACVRARACVCVCVCVRARARVCGESANFLFAHTKCARLSTQYMCKLMDLK